MRHIPLTVFFAKSHFQHSDKKLIHYGIRGVADASPVGLGAFLPQPPKDGAIITSYASRSLTETERRYLQTEKEALGSFYPYVYGTPLELVTHHKPIEAIYGPK